MTFKRYVKILAVMFAIFFGVNFIPMAWYVINPQPFYFRAWEFFDEFAYKVDRSIRWTGVESGDLRRRHLLLFRERWETVVTVDDDGYRQTHPASSFYPIVVSGDSFIFGSGLSDNETMPLRLSHYLGIPVFNGGRTTLANNLAHPKIRGEKILIIEAIAERNFSARRSFRNDELENPVKSFQPIAPRNLGRLDALLEARKTLYTGVPIILRVAKRLATDLSVLIRGKTAVDYMFLEHQMRPIDLKETVEALKERSRILERLGYRYLVVPIPAKQTIYKPSKDPITREFLPSLVSNLVAAEVNVVDLVPAFVEHKREQLFFRYDSHWNPAGADLAAKEISRWILENVE